MIENNINAQACNLKSRMNKSVIHKQKKTN